MELANRIGVEPVICNINTTHDLVRAILMAQGVDVPEIHLKGTVRCNKCHKAMTKPVCSCGKTSCYVSVYFEGDRLRYFTADDKYPFDYVRACGRLAAINSKIMEGTFSKEQDSNDIDKVIEDYLAHKEEEVTQGEFAPASYGNYVYRSKIIADYFKGKNMRNIRTIRYKHIESFKSSIKGSINTKGGILRVFHAIMQWAKNQEIISVMPDFPVIQTHRPPKITLSKDKQSEILDRIPEELQDEHDVLQWGMVTGMRPSAQAALQVQDIDLQAGEVMLCRGFSRGVYRDLPKGKEAKKIKLIPSTRAIAERLIAGRKPTDWLFHKTRRSGYQCNCGVPRCKGEHYQAGEISKLWKKHRTSEIRWYNASRTSLGTNMAKAGASAYQIKEQLTHATLEQGLDYVNDVLESLPPILERVTP